MNTNQKIILITMVLVISGMFLYPPFNLIAKNGTVINMGYAWIFEPPRKVSNVNTAMLLIQWIGVIVVGGIIFILAKSSPNPSTTSSSEIDLWKAEKGYKRTPEPLNLNINPQSINEPTNRKQERGPYPWKTVLLWTGAIFISGFIGVRPPPGSDDKMTIVFKVMFALIYAIIGFVIIGGIKFFWRPKPKQAELNQGKKRVLVLKENLQKQFIEQERKTEEVEVEKNFDSSPKSDEMQIFEGRTDDIEIFKKTLETMPTFFPNIIGQFGYNLEHHKDRREEMWSVHYPNNKGIKYIYNLNNLKVEIVKIVERSIDVNGTGNNDYGKDQKGPSVHQTNYRQWPASHKKITAKCPICHNSMITSEGRLYKGKKICDACFQKRNKELSTKMASCALCGRQTPEDDLLKYMAVKICPECYSWKNVH